MLYMFLWMNFVIVTIIQTWLIKKLQENFNLKQKGHQSDTNT